jgi:DeoR/GlpR family transcriptional regulator of sugar metabolism
MIDLITSSLASIAAEKMLKASPKMLRYIRAYIPILGVKHPSFSEFDDYDYRLRLNAECKARIAFAVSTQVLPAITSSHDESILLDSGSVTYNIAYQLFSYRFGNIVTNNYAIAMLFHEFKHQLPSTCRMLPGEMLRDVCAQGGKETVKAVIQELTQGNLGKSSPTRIAVLGLRAYSPEYGIAEDTPKLTEFQAAMLRHADKLVVVAQGEKFLKKANAPILNSQEFRSIIEQRSDEKSLWFVHHAPTVELSQSQKDYYNHNLDSFLRLLPEDRVFDASRMKVNHNLVVKDEKFLASH